MYKKHRTSYIKTWQNPLLYRILASQSSSGKLGGQEVVSRRSWVRIPPESPVTFFHRHSENTEYAVLYTHWWRAKIVLIVCHPMQQFHQPIKIKYFFVNTFLVSWTLHWARTFTFFCYSTHVHCTLIQRQ